MKPNKYICNICDHEYIVKTTARGVMSSSTDTLDASCPKCKSSVVSKVIKEKK